jgi:hypothetical protein
LSAAMAIIPMQWPFASRPVTSEGRSEYLKKKHAGY